MLYRERKYEKKIAEIRETIFDIENELEKESNHNYTIPELYQLKKQLKGLKTEERRLKVRLHQINPDNPILRMNFEVYNTDMLLKYNDEKVYPFEEISNTEGNYFGHSQINGNGYFSRENGDQASYYNNNSVSGAKLKMKNPKRKLSRSRSRRKIKQTINPRRTYINKSKHVKEKKTKSISVKNKNKKKKK